MTAETPWRDVAGAAAYTGRNPYTIRAAARSGRLRGHQGKGRGRWRFHTDDLDAYMRGELPEVVVPIDGRRRRHA